VTLLSVPGVRGVRRGSATLTVVATGVGTATKSVRVR
jgi:hypothetical protein